MPGSRAAFVRKRLRGNSKLDLRYKKNQEAYEQFLLSAPDTAEVVTTEMYEKAVAMSQAILSNAAARSWLARDGEVEQPMYWHDQASGLDCRSKMDKLLADIAVILDIKSAFDVSPEGFANAMVNFDYDLQAAWYSDGFEHRYGVLPSFVFIVVENKPPYEVGLYDLKPVDLEQARTQNRFLLDAMAQCYATGQWEATHQREVVSLKLPPRAKYRLAYKSFVA